MRKSVKNLVICALSALFAFFLFVGIGNIYSVKAEEIQESTLSITLIGNDTIYLQKGTEYKEFGATAYDTIEGDLTENIVINNPVNKDTVGTYTVSYSVLNSSSESVSIDRTVIVFDGIDERRVYLASYYSNSINKFSTSLELSDGGILVAGQEQTYNYYGYGYTDVVVAKYDVDLTLLWSHTFGYGNYDKTVDVIEDDNGNILLFWTNSGQNFLSIISQDGKIINSKYNFGSGDYYYAKSVANNKYAICYLGYNKVIYLTINPSDYSVLKEEKNISTVLYYAFATNENVYSYYDGKIIKENLETGEVKEVAFLSSVYAWEFFQHGEQLYFCIHKDGINYFYTLDLELNIQTQYSSAGSHVIEMCVNSDKLIAYFYDGSFVVFDALTFGQINTFKTKGNLYLVDDVLLTKGGDVYLTGTSNSPYYCALNKMDIVLFAGLEGYNTIVNEKIDYYEDVGITNVYGDLKGTFTCDFSQVDNTKAGNYKAYYTFTEIEEEKVNTYYIDRDIIVEPKTTFEDGATYVGSKIVDVEGGSVTINGESYSYGDVYNIPGDSRMIITGENGYVKIINFTIELMVDGVEKDTTYYTPVTPMISGGTITLDGEEYVSGTPITKKGYHVLEITAGTPYVLANNNSSYPFKWIDGVFTSTNKQGHSNSTLTVKFIQDGNFSFEYGVSSESGCDYLIIYKNGNEITRISGQTSLQNYNLDVMAGDYIEFTYSHDGSAAVGDDAAYIVLGNGFYKSINFIIEPTIIGVKDGQTYYETLYPNINAENMTLNGEVYNNEPIENCGNYELVITGTNGYIKTINFVIETVITNVINGETYDEQVIPSFTKGVATLNGEEYFSDTTIYTPGVNTLIITGEGGYSVTYTFTVNLVVQNVVSGETYIGEVTPYVSGGIITLNGNSFVSETKIDVPGNYTITVLGAAGFRKDISFIVVPYEVNVEHGGVYDFSLVPVVSKGTLILNGLPYTSGTILNTSGEYSLEIIGENGYYEKRTFTLVTGANVEDGKTYNEPIILKFVGNATLNGESILPDTIIEKVGNYQLILEDGGSTYTYNFIIEPDYSVFDGRLTSCVINFENCLLTLNGNSIVGENVINTVGDYVLVVEGVNGYSKTINFSICAETNVENGAEYSAGLVVNASGGSITLNDEAFVDGTVLSEVGTYTLNIIGNNGHVENIVFNIVPNIAGVDNALVYYNSVTPLINGGALTLNGEEYISGTEIVEEGVYQLVISGVGGYQQIINFVVLSDEFEIQENGVYMQSMSITHDVCDMEINGVPYAVGENIDIVGENVLTFIYNGERTDITFYIFPVISGVKDGDVYTGTVTPVIEWNNLLLDGNVYTSGIEIKEVGNHTLTVANLNGYNYEISFTIVEVLENLEDGGIYEYSVTPKTQNYKELYLDGSTYSNNTTIYSVGYHVLKVVGANGYESEISFTITERMSNLEDGKEYTGSIYPTASYATLYLDGESFSSGNQVYTVGYHTLTVKGTNGYENEYNFTILPTISGALADKEYYPGINISCSYATIKVDGQTWSSGNYVYNVGYHTVEIIGTNDYVYTYEFTIIPSYSGVVEGESYTSSVRFYCDYATLKLNGENYSTGAYIYDLGNHEIEIIGVNGYSKIVSFIRKENTSITDGQEVNYSISVGLDYLADFRNTIVLLDGEAFTSSKTIYELGNHTLTIQGVGGYEVQKTFTIVANWSGVADGATYTSKVGTYLRLRSSSSSSSVLSEDRYEKILLDGQPFTNNTYCYTVGNHKFEIFGSNGYVKEINFVIDVVVDNLYDSASLNHKNDTSYPFSLVDNIYTSTNKGHGSISKYTLTAITDVEFTLQYYVSSETNYDKLLVTKNGNEIINRSGSISWTNYEISLKTGDVLIISYSKDGSVSSGEDCIKFSLAVKSEGVGIKIAPLIYLDNTNIYQDENTYVLLDGEQFELNTAIDVVGYHTLKVVGVGGYEKEYKITVVPEIIDFADNGVYLGSVSPKINRCQLLLDGEEYNSGTIISEVGNHTLSMIGVNDFIMTYNFTVEPINVENYSDKIFYKTVVVDTIPNATLYLDGELYENTEITTLGYHTIKIKGVNGYEQSFNFTISEQPILRDANGYKEFVDGFTSEYMINLIIPDATLFIDNRQYESGTDYYTVGLHYLRIVGENGYEEEYTFTLTEKIASLSNGESYSSIQLDCNGIVSMTLNGVEIENHYAVNTVGNYTLVVVGVNGYTNEYTFTISLELKNVSNGGEYDAAISPIVNASELYLNGEAFVGGSAIHTIGYHTLKIIGAGGFEHQISFTINAKIDGVENGAVYSSNVLPVLNMSQALLNGEVYEAGSVISSVGHYTLKMVGVNGYEKVTSFTIQDNLRGVSDKAIYQETVIPIFNNAKATLDGVTFVSGTPVLDTNIGSHILKIEGVGGYVKEYVFTIEPVVSQLVNGGIYQGNVTPIIKGGKFELNGNAITLGAPIDTIGNNQLKIVGTNGYVKTISFTIEPVVESLASSYLQTCTPKILGAATSMKLNGSTYNNGTAITTVGHNKLVINGYGGYTKTFTITIIPVVSGVEENSTAYGSVNISVSPSAALKIDNVSYTNNSTYSKVGHHMLSITGLNGYIQDISFTLKEENGLISNDLYNEAFSLSYNSSNFKVVIDGQNYTSNNKYYSIGKHSLQIVGSNNYTSNYEITVVPKLTGVEDKGTYNEKISITTNNGSVYIDGVLYSKGTQYKKVGNHTLTMSGVGGYSYSLTFTITPNVVGIVENGSYLDAASWNIPSDCVVKLDDAVVNVNSSTSEIGNHIIQIEGANGYQQRINFTVTESVNVIDGALYDTKLTIDIPDCSAYLNGVEIADLYELNVPGSYTLSIFGTNGYTKEYKFNVRAILSGIIDGKEYSGSVTANTSIGEWYLDDKPYISGTLITEIGHHTLKVNGPEYAQICSFTITVDLSSYANNLSKYKYTNTKLDLYINGEKYISGENFEAVGNHTVEYRGSNGYISSADFTIDYVYKGNSDYKYQGSAIVNIPNALLFVNGTQIDNLTEIDSIGNNIITIKGSGGYEKTIEILIIPTLSIVDGEVRNDKFEIKKFNANMYLDGVAISDDTIVDAHGTHTLRIEGVNGYVQEITFTFDNPNNAYVVIISVLVGLVAIAFVAVIILRRKVL